MSHEHAAGGSTMIYSGPPQNFVGNLITSPSFSVDPPVGATSPLPSSPTSIHFPTSTASPPPNPQICATEPFRSSPFPAQTRSVPFVPPADLFPTPLQPGVPVSRNADGSALANLPHQLIATPPAQPGSPLVFPMNSMSSPPTMASALPAGLRPTLPPLLTDDPFMHFIADMGHGNDVAGPTKRLRGFFPAPQQWPNTEAKSPPAHPVGSMDDLGLDAPVLSSAVGPGGCPDEGEQLPFVPPLSPEMWAETHEVKKLLSQIAGGIQSRLQDEAADLAQSKDSVQPSTVNDSVLTSNDLFSRRNVDFDSKGHPRNLGSPAEHPAGSARRGMSDALTTKQSEDGSLTSRTASGSLERVSAPNTLSVKKATHEDDRLRGSMLDNLTTKPLEDGSSESGTESGSFECSQVPNILSVKNATHEDDVLRGSMLDNLTTKPLEDGSSESGTESGSVECSQVPNEASGRSLTNDMTGVRSSMMDAFATEQLEDASPAGDAEFDSFVKFMAETSAFPPIVPESVATEERDGIHAQFIENNAASTLTTFLASTISSKVLDTVSCAAVAEPKSSSACNVDVAPSQVQKAAVVSTGGYDDHQNAGPLQESFANMTTSQGAMGEPKTKSADVCARCGDNDVQLSAAVDAGYAEGGTGNAAGFTAESLFPMPCLPLSDGGPMGMQAASMQQARDMEVASSLLGEVKEAVSQVLHSGALDRVKTAIQKASKILQDDAAAVAEGKLDKNTWESIRLAESLVNEVNAHHALATKLEQAHAKLADPARWSTRPAPWITFAERARTPSPASIRDGLPSQWQHHAPLSRSRSVSPPLFNTFSPPEHQNCSPLLERVPVHAQPERPGDALPVLHTYPPRAGSTLVDPGLRAPPAPPARAAGAAPNRAGIHVQFPISPPPITSSRRACPPSPLLSCKRKTKTTPLSGGQASARASESNASAGERATSENQHAGNSSHSSIRLQSALPLQPVDRFTPHASVGSCLPKANLGMMRDALSTSFIAQKPVSSASMAMGPARASSSPVFRGVIGTKDQQECALGNTPSVSCLPPSTANSESGTEYTQEREAPPSGTLSASTTPGPRVPLSSFEKHCAGAPTTVASPPQSDSTDETYVPTSPPSSLQHTSFCPPSPPIPITAATLENAASWQPPETSVPASTAQSPAISSSAGSFAATLPPASTVTATSEAPALASPVVPPTAAPLHLAHYMPTSTARTFVHPTPDACSPQFGARTPQIPPHDQRSTLTSQDPSRVMSRSQSSSLLPLCEQEPPPKPNRFANTCPMTSSPAPASVNPAPTIAATEALAKPTIETMRIAPPQRLSVTSCVTPRPPVFSYKPTTPTCSPVNASLDRTVSRPERGLVRTENTPNLMTVEQVSSHAALHRRSVGERTHPNMQPLRPPTRNSSSDGIAPHALRSSSVGYGTNLWCHRQDLRPPFANAQVTLGLRRH